MVVVIVAVIVVFIVIGTILVIARVTVNMLIVAGGSKSKGSSQITHTCIHRGERTSSVALALRMAPEAKRAPTAKPQGGAAATLAPRSPGAVGRPPSATATATASCGACASGACSQLCRSTNPLPSVCHRASLYKRSMRDRVANHEFQPFGFSTQNGTRRPLRPVGSGQRDALTLGDLPETGRSRLGVGRRVAAPALAPARKVALELPKRPGGPPHGFLADPEA